MCAAKGFVGCVEGDLLRRRGGRGRSDVEEAKVSAMGKGGKGDERGDGLVPMAVRRTVDSVDGGIWVGGKTTEGAARRFVTTGCELLKKQQMMTAREGHDLSDASPGSV